MSTTVRTILVASCLILVVGCGWFKKKVVNEVKDELATFRSLVQTSINRLDSENDQWQSIVTQINTELPANVQSTVRTEVQNLVDKSTADVGVEFRSNVDFLSARVKQGLQRILDAIDGKSLADFEPYFSRVIPEAVHLSDTLDRRREVFFTGWDLKSKDAQGQQVVFVLFDGSGNECGTLDSNTQVIVNTHYQITLKMDDPALEALIWQNNAAKIVAKWNSKRQAELGISPWIPKRKSAQVPNSNITFTPPHVAGDGDFDTDDDYPMHCRVRGDLQLVGDTKVQHRVGMHAKEHGDDWTEVSGLGEWQDAYTAPEGWKIVSVLPSPGICEASFDINDHAEHDYGKASGEIVTNFHVWGDKDDDEAGSHTRVQATFADITVELEERRPH